jgi:hypothetical protein
MAGGERTACAASLRRACSTICPAVRQRDGMRDAVRRGEARLSRDHSRAAVLGVRAASTARDNQRTCYFKDRERASDSLSTRAAYTCGPTFCSRRGSVYYRLQHPRRSFDQFASLLSEGMSCASLARALHVCPATITR